MTFEDIAREVLRKTGSSEDDIDRSIRVGMTEYPGVLSRELPAGEVAKYRKLATTIFCKVAELDRPERQALDAYFAVRNREQTFKN